MGIVVDAMTRSTCLVGLVLLVLTIVLVDSQKNSLQNKITSPEVEKYDDIEGIGQGYPNVRKVKRKKNNREMDSPETIQVKRETSQNKKLGLKKKTGRRIKKNENRIKTRKQKRSKLKKTGGRKSHNKTNTTNRSGKGKSNNKQKASPKDTP